MNSMAANSLVAAAPLPLSFDATQTLLRTRALDMPARPGLLACLDGFEILDTIGVGGMGLVLAARDPRSRRRLAIKLLRPELMGNRRALAQFLLEARHMARLRHPHILPVLAVVDRPQGPYYVMPYLKQGSLAQLLRQGQPLESIAALAIAGQVAEALCYAHGRGLIHRDLKPGNVLLDARGRAYLADFGLLRTVFNDALVDVRQADHVGTAPYMSPAVAAGQAEDTRCDIYAFGALLYEMLTGQPPYQGRNTEEILAQVRRGPPRPIATLNPHAASGLVLIVEGAMARELRDRYAQMTDVVADLARLTRGEIPVGPRGRPAVEGRTRGGRIIAFAGGMAVATAGVVLGIRLWFSTLPTLNAGPTVAVSKQNVPVPKQLPAAQPLPWRIQVESFTGSSDAAAQWSTGAGEKWWQSPTQSGRLKIEGRQVEVMEFSRARGLAPRWDWGDGGPVEQRDLPARHVYAKPGEYTIGITTVDGDGRETTENLKVAVGQ